MDSQQAGTLARKRRVQYLMLIGFAAVAVIVGWRCAVCGATVLHKDQVPQFEKAVPLATQNVLRACAQRRPLINMNF